MITLNDNNFELFAARYYDNPACKGLQEFEDDLKRFRYIKRLLKKYSACNILKERLIINHIIVLNNLFGSEILTQMLFYKIDSRNWSQLKTFLVYLNIMPVGAVITYNNTITHGFEIPLDENILEILEAL